MDVAVKKSVLAGALQINSSVSLAFLSLCVMTSGLAELMKLFCFELEVKDNEFNGLWTTKSARSAARELPSMAQPYWQPRSRFSNNRV